MSDHAAGGPLLALLQLCDSLFPVGAFAHSDGLEAATASGVVSRGEDLRAWLDVCLDDTFGRYEGPAVLFAWRAFTEGRSRDLMDLDAEVHAMRPSSASRQASRAMGARLLSTWRRIRPGADLDSCRHWPSGAVVTLPVAFAVACAAAEIELRWALLGFMYTRLAATVSAAMRLMPIGQHEAHRLLADVIARGPDVVQAVIERGDPPAAFTPRLDVALMSQQYLHSRLFRS